MLSASADSSTVMLGSSIACPPVLRALLSTGRRRGWRGDCSIVNHLNMGALELVVSKVVVGVIESCPPILGVGVSKTVS